MRLVLIELEEVIRRGTWDRVDAVGPATQVDRPSRDASGLEMLAAKPCLSYRSRR